MTQQLTHGVSGPLLFQPQVRNLKEPKCSVSNKYLLISPLSFSQASSCESDLNYFLIHSLNIFAYLPGSERCPRYTGKTPSEVPIRLSGASLEDPASIISSGGRCVKPIAKLLNNPLLSEIKASPSFKREASPQRSFPTIYMRGNHTHVNHCFMYPFLYSKMTLNHCKKKIHIHRKIRT